MANPNRHVNRVKLSDFKAKEEKEHSIEIEVDDGTVFTVLPVNLWPDAIGELAAANDDLAAAQLLMGEAQYEQFVAAGGSAKMLFGIIADVNGLTVGESDASSSS